MRRWVVGCGLAAVGLFAVLGCGLPLALSLFPAVNNAAFLIGGNTERAVVVEYPQWDAVDPNVTVGVVDLATNTSRALDVSLAGGMATDGQTLAVVDGGAVRLIDLEAETETRVLEDFIDPNQTMSVAAIDDQRLIVAVDTASPASSFYLVPEDYYVYERDTGEIWQIPGLSSGPLYLDGDRAFGFVSQSPMSDPADPPPYDVVLVDLLTRDTQVQQAGIDPGIYQYDQLYVAGGHHIVWQSFGPGLPGSETTFRLRSYDVDTGVVETLFQAPQLGQSDRRIIVSGSPRGTLVMRERRFAQRAEYSYGLIGVDGGVVPLATFEFKLGDPIGSVPLVKIVGDSTIWRDTESGNWAVQSLETGERVTVDRF